MGSHVVIYVNGSDPGTSDYVSSLGFVDRVEYRNTERPEPIGDATSRLVSWVPSLCRYHLHLEDDWACDTGDSQFIADASLILETWPNIGQIRLRHTSERVYSHNMVTGESSAWKKHSVRGLEFDVSSLHYTFNPTLVRTEDLPKIYPANHETEAARNYLRHFDHVAQLNPGVFRHIGGGHKSLRTSLGRK